MLSEATVVARGTRPPVSSFACTDMSGCTSRKLEDEKRPRRNSPVNTSSNMTGRPDQSVEYSSSGVGEAVLPLVLKRCEDRRITFTSVRWNKGSLYDILN